MLVAFHGKLGSGKDTAGERLAMMAAIPAVRISFAAKLKESAAACFPGVDTADWEEWKNDPNILVEITRRSVTASAESYHPLSSQTAREFLQLYGTQAHRDVFGYDFWVNQALVAYDSYVGPELIFYVTDCRFENEAQAIQDRGGLIFLVSGTRDDIDSTQAQHISEGGLPNKFIDEEIFNDIRDDHFANLDMQLRQIAKDFDIPVNAEAWA